MADASTSSAVDLVRLLNEGITSNGDEFQSVFLDYFNKMKPAGLCQTTRTVVGAKTVR